MVRVIEKERLSGHSDERGTIYFASPKILGFEYKYLTIGSIEPGCKRGGHYHKNTYEKFMCISGRIRYSRDGKETVMLPGDVIEIPLGTMHTFVNDGEETAHFIEFKSREFDEKDPDMHRKEGSEET